MSSHDLPAEYQIRIELLDSGSGRVIQTWTLPRSQTIRIGRAPENDVVVPDPYVSRHHADLDFVDGRWCITNRGRHGILLDGVSVNESSAIETVARFQLGSLGPILRVEPERPRDANSDTTMISAAGALPPRILIDRDHIRNEVDGIVNSPYFRELQQVSRRIRAARA